MESAIEKRAGYNFERPKPELDSSSPPSPFVRLILAKINF